MKTKNQNLDKYHVGGRHYFWICKCGDSNTEIIDSNDPQTCFSCDSNISEAVEKHCIINHGFPDEKKLY